MERDIDDVLEENVREDLITAREALATSEAVEVVNDEIEDEESESVDDESEEESGNSEVVERAKKYGHLSKEEWIAQGRDPKQWKSPEQFDKTGKILEQLYAMKKKVDQRDREIQALVDYQQRTSQREYEKAKQELEQRLAASKDDMDMEGVAHYTKELTRLEHIEQSDQIVQSQQRQQAALENFLERNQHWYNDRNPDLVSRAVEIDNEIKADINAGRIKVNSLDDIAVMIEKRLGYEYPDRVLGAPKGQKPPALSPSHSSVNKSAVNKSSATKVFKALSQEHRDTYNVYKRMNPNITEADFINRLKQDGEI
jgi:hypothetical protein